MINSNDRPVEFVKSSTGTTINYNIKETTNYDGKVSYLYDSITHPSTDDTVLANYLVKLQAVLDKELVNKTLAELVITTTEGNVFDADDTARSDMQSAITAADTLGLTEHNWKLANNTWKIIGIDELKEASALAIQAKGAILAGV